MLAALLCLALAGAPQQNDARALFDQGRVALSTGRFAEARDLFRRSLELVPKAGSAFNLAVAMRGTGEALDAVVTLDRLLRGEYGAIAKEQRAEAEKLREQARADIGTIHVELSGTDSGRIRVDGRPAEIDARGALGVDAGAHVVEASATGYKTVEVKVDVGRGATARVKLVLEPIALTGMIILEGEPDDVVRVVGQAENQGALERALNPGNYRLEAEGPSGLRGMDARIVAGETLRVRIQPEESSWPWLWLISRRRAPTRASSLRSDRETRRSPRSRPSPGAG